LAYLLVFGAFGWLGMRESSVLGFTGTSRVVLNAANAVVVLLPLVSLVATCQAIVRARTSGTFELFLSQPCRRKEWFFAVVASRVSVLCGPLLAILAVLLGMGMVAGEAALPSVVLRAAAVSVALVFSFIGLGLCVSAYSKTSERAIVLALLVWLFGSLLHDFAVIGLLLELRVEPRVVFGLTALNPVEAARLALLGSIDPDLSVLGPVGFWLANQLGARWTLLIGISWPLTLGSVALLFALRRLTRADLVG